LAPYRNMKLSSGGASITHHPSTERDIAEQIADFQLVRCVRVCEKKLTIW
jgi:hypothetical protein